MCEAYYMVALTDIALVISVGRGGLNSAKLGRTYFVDGLLYTYLQVEALRSATYTFES